MRYFAIDTETTGLDTERDQLLEVTIVAAEYPTETPIRDFPRLTLLIHHDRIEGHPIALVMNAKLLTRIGKSEGMPLASVPQAVEAFLWRYNPERPNPVLVAGKNLWKTDMPMLFRAGVSPRQFSRRSLDPGPLFFDPRTDTLPPGLADCCRRAGAPEFTIHDSYEDCLAVIACLHAYWDRQCSPPVSSPPAALPTTPPESGENLPPVASPV